MSLLKLFLKKNTRVARENLSLAFGQEMSSAKTKEVVNACWFNIGRTLVEDIDFCHHPDRMFSKVSFEGLEHLDQALLLKRGVVVVSAHFGNFPLMMVALARKGYQVCTISKPAHDSTVNQFLREKWEATGTGMIYSLPRILCIGQSLKVLRNNGLLFILADQNFGDEGRVFVEFFGRLAATAVGPLIFAHRLQSPIVPIFIIRNLDGTHRVVIEKPFEMQSSSTEDQTLVLNMQSLTNIIEGYIRKYPEQWLWFHKRWKTQPKDKDIIFQKS